MRIYIPHTFIVETQMVLQMARGVMKDIGMIPRKSVTYQTEMTLIVKKKVQETQEMIESRVSAQNSMVSK